MSWSQALTRYAESKDPQRELRREDQLLIHDEYTLAIFDAFPKAKFHFLVLPRLPFPLPPPPPAAAAEGERGEHGDESTDNEPSSKRIKLDTDAGQSSNREISIQERKESSQTTTQKPPVQLKLAGNGKLSFGTASGSSKSIPKSHFKDLGSLLSSPYAAYVLEKMHAMALKVAEIIEDEMPKTKIRFKPDQALEKCGTSWPVRMGFHAIPSMETVHMHVLSGDLVSDRLKNAKHYHSFEPDSGFFLPAATVLEWARRAERGEEGPNGKGQAAAKLMKSEDEYGKMLKGPLVSFRDGQRYSNMPALKAHLEEAWIADILDRRKRRQESKEGDGG